MTRNNSSARKILLPTVKKTKFKTVREKNDHASDIGNNRWKYVNEIYLLVLIAVLLTKIYLFFIINEFASQFTSSFLIS